MGGSSHRKVSDAISALSRAIVVASKASILQMECAARARSCLESFTRRTKKKRDCFKSNTLKVKPVYVSHHKHPQMSRLSSTYKTFIACQYLNHNVNRGTRFPKSVKNGVNNIKI